MWRPARFSYLELPTKEFAEVLRLDPEDGLVHLPLIVTTSDGEIGEESIRQEAIMSLAYFQGSFRHISIYFLILVMASCDILADLGVLCGAVVLVVVLA